MRLIRIAVASVNTTVGAVRSNADRAVRIAHAAAADGATLVVLNEQLVAGYCPEDLVQWRAFVDAQWSELMRFAAETSELEPAFAIGLTVSCGAHLYHAAALVHCEQVLCRFP